MKQGRALLAIALWVGLLPWLAASAAAQDALHEVVAGDALRSMAGYYYGDTRQWERIWNANRDQIRNPNRVERGLLLLIPDAKPPAEPYADFLARIRPIAAMATTPQIAVPPIPRSPEATASAGEAGTSPPAPSVAPGMGPAPVAAPPAKTPAAPAKAAPEKAAPPAPGPAPAKGPAPVAAPAGTQPPAPSAAAPAPLKQAGTPAARPGPPPPPKEWYEELLSPELFTSIGFLAGAGVLVLGLLGLFLWRRRTSAQGAE
jgi:hypothetical protein